ncbi:hypothetical protein CCACVL1_22009 [Corchorus capsularis]|uniref:Uncharacterized protein n=1 Tax=Corchorus capsularis TaxID=210143 RepID=A0A1R3H1D9_COCAP|nr:hypothetical protein CCACVL1_22009 [Corchorus capsularis]
MGQQPKPTARAVEVSDVLGA